MKGENLKRPLLDRIIGIETEYAFAYDRHAADRTNSSAIIESIIRNLSQDRPFAKSLTGKEGIFLDNGAAVFPERKDIGPDIGLIEGATPECKSVRDVIAHSRALDKLLAKALARSEWTRDVRLIKNCKDAVGNVYGAQESYDVEMVSGTMLVVWRVCFSVLIMMTLWPGEIFAVFVLFSLLLAYRLISFLIGLLLKMLDRELYERFNLFLVNRLEDVGFRLTWFSLESFSYIVVWLPYQFASAVCFRKYQKTLNAFLVSRPILSGAGWQGPEGNFELADKASSVRRLFGLGGSTSPSVYELGHLIKPVFLNNVVRPRKLFRPLRKRQRLQISLGDSNMAEHAEYLRIGTTSLVLDAIERGYLKHAPRFRQPIAALRTFCKDPSLKAKVRCADGVTRTAIQIQQVYLTACQEMVDDSPFENIEAREIIRLWDETLHELIEEPLQLVGRLDWVTKKYLIDKLGDSDRKVAKKIDLRYHELSNNGYFSQLKNTELVVKILNEREIEHAQNSPPPATRAKSRAELIRANSSRNQTVCADWDRVQIGSLWRGQVTHL